MISFYHFFVERAFVPTVAPSKGVWKIISANSDKLEFSPELISLVQQAYSKTPEGSFVNTTRDVLPSDWNSIDLDSDEDIDATIFYRSARPQESWTGQKIQGIGHDGNRNSIDQILNKLVTLLKGNDQWWIEASDALEHVLYKKNANYIEDVSILQHIFSDPNLNLIGDRGKYNRQLSENKFIQESVFGMPGIK